MSQFNQYPVPRDQWGMMRRGPKEELITQLIEKLLKGPTARGIGGSTALVGTDKVGATLTGGAQSSRGLYTLLNLISSVEGGKKNRRTLAGHQAATDAVQGALGEARKYEGASAIVASRKKQLAKISKLFKRFPALALLLLPALMSGVVGEQR